jgi:hypothetical protein
MRQGLLTARIRRDKDARIKLIVSPAALKALAAMQRRDRAALLDRVEDFAAAPFG